MGISSHFLPKFPQTNPATALHNPHPMCCARYFPSPHPFYPIFLHFAHFPHAFLPVPARAFIEYRLRVTGSHVLWVPLNTAGEGRGIRNGRHS